MNGHKYSKRQVRIHYILFLTLGGCLLCSCKDTTNTSETSQSPAVLGDPVKAIAEIMKPRQENKIDGFKVFYFGWDNTYIIPLSETELISKIYNSKTVYKNGYAFAFGLSEPLKSFAFNEVPNEEWDCRISFVFTSADKDILRLTLVRQSGIVLINGKGHKTTRALTNKLMRHVPYFDYLTYDQLWPELAGQPDS
jgi:hypothetical protein